MTLFQAVVYSINSFFCEIGKELGAGPDRRRDGGVRLLLVPPLETPADERRISGLYKRGKPFAPSDSSQVDPGRLAFGQERAAGDTAADGDGRGRRRERGVADAAVRRRPSRRAGRVESSRERNGTHSGGRSSAYNASGARAHDGGRRRRAAPARARRSPACGSRARPEPPRPGRAGRNRPGSSRSLRSGRRGSRSRSMLENQTGVGGTTAAPIAKEVMQASCGARRSANLWRPSGRLGHADQHALRRALSHHPQARRGRDGERLPRGGPGARPAGRDQDPERPARERRPVRRAVPARGEERRRRSRIRTSSRSTTAARPKAPTTSRWSSSTDTPSRS